MTSAERYKVLINIISQVGIDGEVISELAKAESMINLIDQKKMMPPPVPDIEPTEPTMSQQPDQTAMGKYDNL